MTDLKSELVGRKESIGSPRTQYELRKNTVSFDGDPRLDNLNLVPLLDLLPAAAARLNGEIHVDERPHSVRATASERRVSL